MPPQHQLCQACGRSAAAGEQFAAFPAKHATRPGASGSAPQTILCPDCARERSLDPDLAYSFCDQCAGPIEPGQAQLRSKTSSSMAGPAPFSSAVTLVLCPRCAAGHDGTARWLLVCLGVFVGAVALLGAVGHFLR